jgi:hypothetical protein
MLDVRSNNVDINVKAIVKGLLEIQNYVHSKIKKPPPVALGW